MSRREYQDLVLAAFKKKLDDKLLPLELVSPTRKSLKKYSYDVCLQRYDPKDELLLSSFFGQRDNPGAYANAIDLSKAEKFRTLHNFLNDKTESTDFVNISMLAWLIDFQPRPYHENLRIVENAVMPVQPESASELPGSLEIQPTNDLTPEQVIEEIKEEETVNEVPPTGPKGDELPPVKKTFDNRRLIGIAVIIFCGFALWQLLPGNNCMYWKNDHYVPTDCNLPRRETPFVKLDPARLKELKRLHHVDTLTYNSVGKLWYIRVDGIIEVYTAKGQHPLYPERNLLPLTYYAVNVCKNQHGY